MSSALSGTPVLVTGAGGFIGSHLAERLVRDGATVRAMVHYNALGRWGNLELTPREILSNIEIVAGDVRDPFFTREAVRGRRIVFHLASLIAIPYSYAAPHSYVATNVVGALNVLEACRAEGVDRVIHTSTSEAYGTARYVPIDEAHPLQGQSPYSASKIGADMIAESYWRSFGVPVVTIRPFNTFGPRQSIRAVIPTIITQVLTGTTVRLGSLYPTRDLNYVDDTVEAFLAGGIAPPCAIGTVTNIGSGREIGIGDLANLILRLMGRECKIESGDTVRLRPEASEVERLLCDNTQARTLLGWSPKITLEEGLTHTIEWFKHHHVLYRCGRYTL